MHKKIKKFLGFMIVSIIFILFMLFVGDKKNKLPNMTKIDNQNYRLEYGSMKLKSELKWVITSIDTLCGYTYFRNDIRKKLHISDTITHMPNIKGKHKRERFIVKAFPIHYINPEIFYKRINEDYFCKNFPKFVSDMVFDRELNNINADSLYRVRMFIKSVNDIGACWELRFKNKTIQSVFAWKEYGGNIPPKDISIINDIDFEPLCTFSDNDYCLSFIKDSEYKIKIAMAARISGGRYNKTPELIHLFLLHEFMILPYTEKFLIEK